MLEFAVAEDGCRTAFDVVGEGSTVLLIAGLGGAASFWEDIVTELSHTRRVVTFDHRGTGRSDRPEGAYSIEAITADAVAVLDAVGAETAHVVGHSTGGKIAQILALDHVERVASLTLSGTWARFDRQMAELFTARSEVLRLAGPETYQRLTHALGFPSSWIESHAEILDAAISRADQGMSPRSVALARIAMLPSTDRSEELAALNVPTLVVGARDDLMIPFAQSELLHALIPGARLEEFAGSHFFPRVHPGRFAAVVSNFFNVVEAHD